MAPIKVTRPVDIAVVTIKVIAEINKQAKKFDAFEIIVPVYMFQALIQALPYYIYRTPETEIGGNAYANMIMIVAKNEEAYEKYSHDRDSDQL